MLANPQIVLLKEGTDTSQGVPQIIGNISACNAIADAIRTTLGPRGMDKIIIDEKSNATISNDGAEILKKLDIIHPVGATLVQIALSQDDEVGDGTTSVVLLASEFLKNAKAFIEEGVHPELIQKAYRRATKLLLNKLHNDLAVRIDDQENSETRRNLLVRCAETALSSKLVAGHKKFFAEMVVEAVQMLNVPENEGANLKPLDMIGIKKVAGGSLQDSKLVAGVAFKKTFSYAGFEMQPKHYQGGVKIALLNVELELKAERENAEIRVNSVEEYEKVVNAEWTILYEKLEALEKSGAKIVLSKLPIGDVATQYFADRDMFCAGRVADKDMERTRKACGGAILTSVTDLNSKSGSDVLGACEQFHEMQIGAERYNLFTGCPQSRTCTLILRGGADQFMEETERSLHDAIMIVRRASVNHAIVAGGGAIDMELSRYLRDVSLTIKGRDQQFYAAMAKSFETIPRTLCENAGLDATNMLNLLRHAHAKGQKWAGVDIENDTVTDNYEACVWEPALVKGNAITAASEAACIVLTLDETIRNAKSKTPEDNRPVMPPGGGGGGRGRGRNGRPMM